MYCGQQDLVYCFIVVLIYLHFIYNSHQLFLPETIINLNIENKNI